jgi:hypothetical protein
MLSVFVFVYVVVHLVCLICGLRSLQLLVNRHDLGYHPYIVSSAVDSSFVLVNFRLAFVRMALHVNDQYVYVEREAN